MLKLALCALALTAAVAFADPAIVTHYDNGVLRVALEGSYAGAQYRVLRSDGAAAFPPVGPDEALCTGECYALDLRADPGVTYLYRFDLFFSDGSSARYGPYPVTVPVLPLGVRLFPNPLRGAGQVELTLPGSRL